MTAYNVLSKEEAEDLRYILDDADMLGASGAERERRMLSLWRRLHLWLLSEQGDRYAKMLLSAEFPDHLAAAELQDQVDRLQRLVDGDEFWSKVVYPDGMTAEHVRAELADFNFIIEQLPKVYCHITGDRLSKHMYSADTVIRVAEDHMQELIERAIDERRDQGEDLIVTLEAIIEGGTLDDQKEAIAGLRELIGRPVPAEATS
jgi:hypothetical protein